MRNRFDFRNFFMVLGIWISLICLILGAIFAYYEDLSYLWLWVVPAIFSSVLAGSEGF